MTATILYALGFFIQILLAGFIAWGGWLAFREQFLSRHISAPSAPKEAPVRADSGTEPELV